MKRVLYLFSMVLANAIFAQNPQIPNNSFENWTPVTFKSLQDYFDAADEGATNTQQMQDAVSGQYSVKLETSLSPDNELHFGFFINFDPDTFSGGVPYTAHVDSICGYYKAHLVAQDTAILITMFKNAGTPIGGNVYNFAADKNTNSWTRFCYPTQMPTAVVPDTLMLGAASSNAINEIGMEAGSWIQYDSIFFKSGQQLAPPPPNHSFENWDERIIEFPDGYDSSLRWDITTTPLPIEKVADATSGNYAIKLNTVINQFQDTITGGVTNAVFGDWPFSGGMEVTQVPNEVSWDLKVEIVGHAGWDPNIYFDFKQAGNIIHSVGNTYSQSTNNYVHESYTLNLSSTPDTLQFIAFSGNQPGNNLWIDNIVLYYPAGITENLNIKEAVAYPNPARDVLNFKIEAIKPEDIDIQILDIIGKEIFRKKFQLHQGENHIQIPTIALASGNYLVRFNTEYGNFSRKFIKK